MGTYFPTTKALFPLPSSSLSPFSLSSPSASSPSLFPSTCFSLPSPSLSCCEAAPFDQLDGLGERCMLYSAVCSSRRRFRCILRGENHLTAIAIITDFCIENSTLTSITEFTIFSMLNLASHSASG